MTTKILTVHFTDGGNPVTGLSPTIDIYELDPTTPSINTLIISGGPCTEIGGGWYRYQFSSYDASKPYVFTFDGGSGLAGYERFKVGGNETYADEVASGVWDEQANQHTQTGSTGLVLQQVKADTGAVSISNAALQTLVATLLKYEKNRTRIDTVNKQMIIYDDDCVTELHRFNLRDANGNPSVAEVCERSPVACP